MTKKREEERAKITYSFNNVDPEKLRQVLVEICADKVAKIVQGYPPEIAQDLGYEIIKSLNKEQLIDLALCDTRKFNSKLEED